MQIDIRARAAGKTTAVIEWLAKDPRHRVLVTHSDQAAQGVLRMARRFYPDIPWLPQNFVSINSAGTLRARTGNIEIWVDNADLCLQQQLYGAVRGVTWELTGEPLYGTPVRDNWPDKDSWSERAEQMEADAAKWFRDPNVSVLPVKCEDTTWDEIAAQTGIEVKDASLIDALDIDPKLRGAFHQVALPEGWSKRAGKSVYWTYICDQDGQPRLSVYFKRTHYQTLAYVMAPMTSERAS